VHQKLGTRKRNANANTEWPDPPLVVGVGNTRASFLVRFAFAVRLPVFLVPSFLRGLRGGDVAAGVVVALSTSGIAYAESSLGGLLHLTWTAPAECPTQARLEAQVADLLGGPTEAASHVRASARAWRGEDAIWHVEIHTQTGPATGERRVDGESCQAIADATALILAVAVDPEAVAARAAPETVRETPRWDPTDVPSPVVVMPGPVVEAAPPLPAIPAPTSPDVPLPLHGAIMAIAGLDAGTLPRTATWFGAGVTGSRGSLRLEARAILFSEQTTYLRTPSSAGGDFDLTAAGLTLCQAVRMRSPTLDLCGGLEAGLFRARGFGVTDPSKADPLWLSITPGVVGTWPLGSALSLRLEASGGIPLKRPGFDLDPYGQVHRASPVIGRLSFGPQLHFR